MQIMLMKGGNPMLSVDVRALMKGKSCKFPLDEVERQLHRKPRILCLHGFRASAAILKKLIGRWPEIVLEQLELVFLDAPFPAQGISGCEGRYDPPYYEWFQSNDDFSEYRNFEECLHYIENYMVEHGPFDGLLGFSQGAVVSAAVPGMQRDGVAFTKVPKMKFVIVTAGAKFGGHRFPGTPTLAANAYSSPIACPSLHIIGEQDIHKQESIALVESFVAPVVILHSKGHTDSSEYQTFEKLPESWKRIIKAESGPLDALPRVPDEIVTTNFRLNLKQKHVGGCH